MATNAPLRLIDLCSMTANTILGINDAGLALSLTFGGRNVVGDGFAISIVLRYILEFCATAAEAAEVLSRVPVHMASAC